MSGTSPPGSLPPANFTSAPVLFADGVANVALGNNVVKFYLVRVDPSMSEDTPDVRTISGQVVMPIEAFVSTAVFFRERLEYLIKSGVVEQSRVDAMYKSVQDDTP